MDKPLFIRYQMMCDDTSGDPADQRRVAELVCSLVSVKLFILPSCSARIVIYTLPQHMARFSQILDYLGLTDYAIVDLAKPEDEKFASTIEHCTFVDRLCIRRMLADFRELPEDAFRLLIGTDCYFFRRPAELLSFLGQDAESREQVLYMVDNYSFAGKLYRLTYYEKQTLEGLMGDFYCLAPGVSLEREAILSCLKMIDSWPKLGRWVPERRTGQDSVHACEQQAASILLGKFSAKRLTSVYSQFFAFPKCEMVHAHIPAGLIRKGTMPKALAQATLKSWRDLGLNAVADEAERPLASSERVKAALKKVMFRLAPNSSLRLIERFQR
jgi:hypothetical protein